MFHYHLQPHNPGPEHEAVTGGTQPVETPQHLPPQPVQQQQQEQKPVQIEAPATPAHQLETAQSVATSLPPPPQPQLVEAQSAQPQVCVFITFSDRKIYSMQINITQHFVNRVNNDGWNTTLQIIHYLLM